MFENFRRRVRGGKGASKGETANFYAGLCDAGVLKFVGWDASGEPEFEGTRLGKQVFCQNCAAPAASAVEEGDRAILRCSDCGATWYGNARTVEVLPKLWETARSFAEE